MAKDVYFKNVPPDGNRPSEEPDFEDISTAFPYPSARRENRTATSVRPQQTHTAQASPARQAAADRSVPRKKKKKKHVFAKALLLLLILVLTVCVAGTATLAYVLGDYKSVTLKNNAYVNSGELMHSANVYNILLMGVDTDSTEDSTRSDAMILLSLDALHGQMKLTTFMRDMYVTVPGHGDTKLTHACMYEGPQLTVDTIELNFGIDIDAYVKIGYDVFIDIVNGVGGITVAEIDDTESWALAEEHVYVDPGTNIHLNGEQAIKYVRIRHGQSDFARTERQREAITLILQQAKKTSPAKLLKLARQIAGKAECSIPKGEFISIALKASRCLLRDVAQQQIPADGTWDNATRDGLAVLLVNFDENRRILKDFIY
ncbi:MAG: LCP family protein [Clostridia bacterium]|nr:LCP family protein [Clostridia bacterium]